VSLLTGAAVRLTGAAVRLTGAAVRGQVGEQHPVQLVGSSSAMGQR
jgi:hypothetical protein